MSIRVNDLKFSFKQYQKEFEDKALEILRGGYYIMGSELKSFEEEWAKYNKSTHSIGVASGLDAIWMTLKCLGIGEGDEVITQANTFIASVMGITMNNATPVFVEPDEYYGIDANKIEEKITDKTRAIIAVHLYGMPCQMDKITEICQKHNLLLIEDCAQSHGATFMGRRTGTFGSAGCFSFYPTKNLGAFGDGGAVITNDDDLNKSLRIYRNYGSEIRYHNKIVGANSRLDEIQAGFLRVKLSHIEEINRERAVIADNYLNGINNSKIILPKIRNNTSPVWHQFVIRCQEREALMAHLNHKGIDTLIHYPIPPHLSECYNYLGFKNGDFPITEEYADTVLSIPIYNGLTKNSQDIIIESLNGF